MKIGQKTMFLIRRCRLLVGCSFGIFPVWTKNLLDILSPTLSPLVASVWLTFDFAAELRSASTLSMSSSCARSANNCLGLIRFLSIENVQIHEYSIYAQDIILILSFYFTKHAKKSLFPEINERQEGMFQSEMDCIMRI